MTVREMLGAVEALVATWQAKLGSDVQIVLGGSLVSDTFVIEGAKVVDVDVRFLVVDSEASGLVERIEAVTGLKYRKTIQVGDWPSGTSVGHMIEGFLQVHGIDLPCEVEGCLRNRKYVGWHQFYQQVFSAEELADFRAQKLSLRGDKKAYKALKSAMREECVRRAVEKGIVSPDRSPFDGREA